MKKSLLRLHLILLIVALGFVQPLYAQLGNQPPALILKAWLKEDSGKSMGLHPNATLATAVNNKPSIRMIQTYIDEQGGIEFYTHANTEKALHQKENANAALHFWLGNARKQISVEGKMQALPKERLDRIWQAMPRWMQLNFIASDHNSVLPSTSYLKEKVAELDRTLDKTIPRPAEFIGFKLIANKYLFYAIKMPEPADKYRAVKTKSGWLWAQLQP